MKRTIKLYGVYLVISLIICFLSRRMFIGSHLAEFLFMYVFLVVFTLVFAGFSLLKRTNILNYVILLVGSVGSIIVVELILENVLIKPSPYLRREYRDFFSSLLTSKQALYRMHLLFFAFLYSLLTYFIMFKLFKKIGKQ